MKSLNIDDVPLGWAISGDTDEKYEEESSRPR
jgi:hypothetical protein